MFEALNLKAILQRDRNYFQRRFLGSRKSSKGKSNLSVSVLFKCILITSGLVIESEDRVSEYFLITNAEHYLNVREILHINCVCCYWISLFI